MFVPNLQLLSNVIFIQYFICIIEVKTVTLYAKNSLYLMIVITVTSILVLGFSNDVFALQYARPTGVVAGGWHSGDHLDIDEVTRNDADYMTSIKLKRDKNDLVEISLGTINDPQTNDGHIVRYTYREENLQVNTDPFLTVRLLQGGTEIVSWTHNYPLPTLFTPATQTLTTLQADSITDYSNLRLEFNAVCDGTCDKKKKDAVSVSWVEFEVPDPATVPDTPTSLSVTAINSAQIDLSWTTPSSDGGSAISGYQIERESPIGGGWAILLANTGNTNTNYSDSGLDASTEYNYRVSAINDIGVGPTSDIADATTDATTVPSIVIRSTGDDSPRHPPEFLGIGFYKIIFVSESEYIASSNNLETNKETFGKYFPYSDFSNVLDAKNYGSKRDFEKHGAYFLIDDYLKDVTSFSAEVEQPIQIQIRLFKERQTLEVQHFAVYMNSQEPEADKNSDTYIIFDKTKPLEIVDPNGFFEKAELNTSLEGEDLFFILDITFKKPMEKSDLFVEAWNVDRDVSYFHLIDAIEVIDPEKRVTEIQEIPLVAKVFITHDASSPICKARNSCFSPLDAEILAGGTVIWKNVDSFLHTVVSGLQKTGADGKFNSIVIPKESVQIKFENSGIYNYYCIIHPWAAGVVKVYDGDLPFFEESIVEQELTVVSERFGSSVLIENYDTIIPERSLRFDVSGNIRDELGRGTVELIITKPDGTKNTLYTPSNKDGYFFIPIIIYDWEPGSYGLSVNSKGTQMGSLSFFVVDRRE